MSRTEPVAPTQVTAVDATHRGMRARLERRMESLALQAHRHALRFDVVPSEFGTAGPVDEDDARAVASEWLRLARQWADYNPEQVFALKVGATMLGATLLALWILVGMIS